MAWTGFELIKKLIYQLVYRGQMNPIWVAKFKLVAANLKFNRGHDSWFSVTKARVGPLSEAVCTSDVVQQNVLSVVLHVRHVSIIYDDIWCCIAVCYLWCSFISVSVLDDVKWICSYDTRLLAVSFQDKPGN